MGCPAGSIQPGAWGIGLELLSGTVSLPSCSLLLFARPSEPPAAAITYAPSVPGGDGSVTSPLWPGRRSAAVQPLTRLGAEPRGQQHFESYPSVQPRTISDMPKTRYLAVPIFDDTAARLGAFEIALGARLSRNARYTAIRALFPLSWEYACCNL